MGIRTGGLSRIYYVFPARESAGGEFETAIFVFAFMYPGYRYVRKYPAMYNLNKTKKKQLLSFWSSLYGLPSTSTTWWEVLILGCRFGTSCLIVNITTC